MAHTSQTKSLEEILDYTPQVLKFGTSGRRGLVVDLTQLEIYTNVTAELQYLQSLSLDQGGINQGDDFFYAYDLRPSSTQYVENGRGGLSQAVERAITDAGMVPVNLGAIPTPALTYWAIKHGKGSIMVTGSHIPFDRNGYKLNTSKGELLKEHEKPIGEFVTATRKKLLAQPSDSSIFGSNGLIKDASASLKPEIPIGRSAYIKRYTEFLRGESLKGLKLLAYQHSAVGRDLIVEVFEALGAKVTAAGRSDTFVPIDTEAIDKPQLDTLQALYDQAGADFDAIISTDGDSDRPLVLAPKDGALRFFGGDLLGMVVADFLQVDAAVVPISSNDAIDSGPLAAITEPKTKIGSPYVIAGMEHAVKRGKSRVCGWEANGGFLTACNLTRNGKVLESLPTRDAVLPIACVLFAAVNQGKTLPQLFDALPQRFSRSSLLRNFPRPTSMQIIHKYSPVAAKICQVRYDADEIKITDDEGSSLSLSAEDADKLKTIKTGLQSIFSTSNGFEEISRIDYTDGVRITFAKGDVAHVRPSGNADELRIYAVANSKERVDTIVEAGIREPDGLLRQLAKSV